MGFTHFFDPVTERVIPKDLRNNGYKNHSAQAVLTAWGIILGKQHPKRPDVRHVTLPAGWQITCPYGPEMEICYLIDQKGNVRSILFYGKLTYTLLKQAVTIDASGNEDDSWVRVLVKEKLVFKTLTVAPEELEITYDDHFKVAEEWADREYPNRHDPLAYW